MAWFQTFPSKSKRRNLFPNASKRQIKIIYFYVIKTPQYKIIAGDSQTHIILGSGTQTTFSLALRENVKNKMFKLKKKLKLKIYSVQMVCDFT